GLQECCCRGDPGVEGSGARLAKSLAVRAHLQSDDRDRAPKPEVALADDGRQCLDRRASRLSRAARGNRGLCNQRLELLRRKLDRSYAQALLPIREVEVDRPLRCG